MTEDTEPTNAELVADIFRHLDTLERWVDALRLDGSPRYRKLLLDTETHLANAVSALDAAIQADADAFIAGHRATENPYDNPGPIPPFHKQFRKTE